VWFPRQARVTKDVVYQPCAYRGVRNEEIDIVLRVRLPRRHDGFERHWPSHLPQGWACVVNVMHRHFRTVLGSKRESRQSCFWCNVGEKQGALTNILIRDLSLCEKGECDKAVKFLHDA
jgi:hypothetical protein